MLVSLVSGRTSESSDRPILDAGDTETEETHGTLEICVIQMRSLVQYVLRVILLYIIVLSVKFHCQNSP
jgi:hypothetical protein